VPVSAVTSLPATQQGRTGAAAAAAEAEANAKAQTPVQVQLAPAPPPAPTGPVTRFLGPFGTPLRQYRYAVFASYVSTFAPIDDVPVGPDYIVGPGDNLTINIWGPVENNFIRTVDRNGQILLPRVGDLRVWGLTFAQADRLIREQLSRYFRGF